jgi:RNA polymerase sigma-70 factor, ECF subfamily
MIRTAVSMARISESDRSPDVLEIEALVQRVLAGDSAAFEGLIVRYERRVLTLAMKLLGTAEDAQDAAQEVFIRVYKYLHRLDVQKPIEPWLIRMTVNVCRDLGRKRQRRFNTFSDTDTIDAPDTAKTSNPHTGLVEEQEKQLLWQALNSLPEKERIAVTLRDIEGLSTAEVAAILESSETTVRSQISRARVRLKNAIQTMIGGMQ